jgi:hypothetical protein
MKQLYEGKDSFDIYNTSFKVNAQKTIIPILICLGGLHANLNTSNIYIGEACWQNVSNFADLLCLPCLPWPQTEMILFVLCWHKEARQVGVV